MAEQAKVNRDRILKEFLRLTAFDAESFHERKIAEYVKERLRSLGLVVEEDHAREKIAKEHP